MAGADPVAAWHAYLDAPNAAALEALIAEDCVFRSPAVHEPQAGKALTVRYLTAAVAVLGTGDFRYTGEWRSDRSAVLEFECTLAGGIAVNGVDIIAWGGDGRIIDFKVMIRPLKALNAVVQAMGERLAHDAAEPA